MADLLRKIDTNIKFHMDFIKISSYEGKRNNSNLMLGSKTTGIA